MNMTGEVYCYLWCCVAVVDAWLMTIDNRSLQVLLLACLIFIACLLLELVSILTSALMECMILDFQVMRAENAFGGIRVCVVSV